MVSHASSVAFGALGEAHRTEYNREVRRMHENRIFNRWAGFHIFSYYKLSRSKSKYCNLLIFVNIITIFISKLVVQTFEHSFDDLKLKNISQNFN